jgi:hypothetical protein
MQPRDKILKMIQPHSEETTTIAKKMAFRGLTPDCLPW